ncbi:co-chaperone HscB [Micromonospora tulbaghiae]|uniref:Co-chaperone HscB n=1 Tax=Micromonospora tulbaghiae TaxID=479978 RepID=A0AAW4JFT8_9ACTN|nr:co-chaperone HscB [Micromonospora tulbaghiae]MBO4138613.1 co-chaperone HscB [Micromonospora tulbaghiae]
MTTADFLVRAAREFRRGGWVFTGFHWPVLAGQCAYALPGAPFSQVFEAGASAHRPGADVPTSTTDYPAYAGGFGWLGGTADVLLAMGHRFDRVVLDAGNVDLRGRINSSYLGPRERPTVRLPGGGGAADIAAAARELVLLHGATDPRRIVRAVEHVTAAPAPDALVRLHTRWGVVRLGADPRLEEVTPDGEVLRAHLATLGVPVEDAVPRPPVSAAERAAAVGVLRRAAVRGYSVAKGTDRG